MKSVIKRLVNNLGLEITRYRPKPLSQQVVSLRPRGSSHGNVLLSYVIEPFLLKDGEQISNAHTHDWESFQMAETFLRLGYAVDVIDYDNRVFIPQKEYLYFVSARTNFQRIAQLLNECCVKIVHLDTAHWLFNNSAAYQRCLDLQHRRGVAIESIKWVEPNWAMECADFATLLGNQFTMDTYAYARKAIYQIPISTCAVYPPPENKDFNSCRKSYLWFGSSGLVHKGLDLVLEAFRQMPDYHLYVCGPISEETDFQRAFREELYETPNIHTMGWVDVTGPEFTRITEQCVGLIYPSCSEGQSGAVVACLHAGLIPVLSYESGVSVDDFGIILNDCSTASVMNSMELVSSLPSAELKARAQGAWDYARENHTRERFAAEYLRIVEAIIKMEHTVGDKP